GFPGLGGPQLDVGFPGGDPLVTGGSFLGEDGGDDGQGDDHYQDNADQGEQCGQVGAFGKAALQALLDRSKDDGQQDRPEDGAEEGLHQEPKGNGHQKQKKEKRTVFKLLADHEYLLLNLPQRVSVAAK